MVHLRRNRWSAVLKERELQREKGGRTIGSAAKRRHLFQVRSFAQPFTPSPVSARHRFGHTN
eukprot:1186858-Prorocentrum_minimum.AAC.3